MDNRFYHGESPYQKQPFTVKDIVFLIARLTTSPSANKLNIIQAYYITDYNGVTICRKYHFKRKDFARFLHTIKREYGWFVHKDKNKIASFSLKDIIALVSDITLRLNPRYIRIIQGYYDTDGNWRKTCQKCHISKTALFRFFRKHIKKAILKFHLD